MEQLHAYEVDTIPTQHLFQLALWGQQHMRKTYMRTTEFTTQLANIWWTSRALTQIQSQFATCSKIMGTWQILHTNRLKHWERKHLEQAETLWICCMMNHEPLQKLLIFSHMMTMWLKEWEQAHTDDILHTMQLKEQEQAHTDDILHTMQLKEQEHAHGWYTTCTHVKWWAGNKQQTTNTLIFHQHT